MSRSINLFAQSSDIGLKGFVKDLQETLGLPFEYLPDDEIDFLYFAQRMNNETNSIERFWVGDHTYASTRGLPLSEYRFDIELDTSSDDWKFTPPKREQMKDALGYTVFEQLKATGRYDLLLVDDVQRKLAEFHPTRQEM